MSLMSKYLSKRSADAPHLQLLFSGSKLVSGESITNKFEHVGHLYIVICLVLGRRLEEHPIR